MYGLDDRAGGVVLCCVVWFFAQCFPVLLCMCCGVVKCVVLSCVVLCCAVSFTMSYFVLYAILCCVVLHWGVS